MARQRPAFPPSLFLIGAQKAGTTTLAYLLAQHPEIQLSQPKEPNFFADRYEKGWAWYRSCFAPASATAPQASVLLDASTSYTMAALEGGRAASQSAGPLDIVPRRIRGCVPDARFIYLLRDPVERTISAYRHDRRAGRICYSLREAIDSVPFYTDVSRYWRQIQPYLDYFPRERFLFASFEELSNDAIGLAGRCISFAGLELSQIDMVMDRPRNVGFAYNGLGRFVFDGLAGPQRERAARVARKALPAPLYRQAKQALTTTPAPVSPKDRCWLAEKFCDDNRAMEALIGFRFYR